MSSSDRSPSLPSTLDRWTVSFTRWAGGLALGFLVADLLFAAPGTVVRPGDTLLRVALTAAVLATLGVRRRGGLDALWSADERPGAARRTLGALLVLLAAAGLSRYVAFKGALAAAGLPLWLALTLVGVAAVAGALLLRTGRRSVRG